MPRPSPRPPPRRIRLAGIEAIDFPASEDAPVAVCLHGYGADAADLAPLALELGLEGALRWVFPDAPSPIDTPFAGGRMWFPIDAAVFAEAQRTGVAPDLSGETPPGFDAAHDAARAFLDALGVPWSRLILGGFSQGSMLALELALRAPENPRGLFILSGNLLDEGSLRRRAPARAETQFFQSHGSADPLLGFNGARRLEAALQAAGLKGKLRRFEGGHAIPPELTKELAGFLSSLG